MKKPLSIVFWVIMAGMLMGVPVWGGEAVGVGEMMPGALDGTERKCLDCHRTRNLNTNEGVLSSRAFCYECHGQETCRRIVEGEAQVSLRVSPDAFEKTRHQTVACIQCHTDVAGSLHRSSTGVQCLGCHSPHGEGTAHDPHVRVRCEACHTESASVERDPETGRIRLARADREGNLLSFTEHRMTQVDQKEFCARCHHTGNPVGAPSMVLPPKSVLCIACHSTSLGMGHWIFWAAFSVGLLGFLGTAAFWFRGEVGGEEKSTHRKVAVGSEAIWDVLFSKRIFAVVKTLFFDVFLQRRILRESVRRWSIHSLLFYGFLGRFFLSLFAGVLHRIAPESGPALALLDKNHWLTAFAYDLLGLFILLGVLWAAVTRFLVRPRHVLSEEQDNLTLIFMGLIVLTGFALEGARILMTGIPFDVAVFSFVGYGASRLWLLIGSEWQGVYGVLWYAHAILWAFFIAYLPFGKFKHLFTTPLNLLLRDAGEK